MADVSFYFVNGASNLTINSTSDYRLLGYDGIEATDIEFSGADNAVGDGGYMQSIRVPMRRISINGMVSGSTVETLRAAVMGFFKPKILYTLSVTRNSITRNINCYLVTGVKFTQQNINLPVYFTLELICPDPYFTATTATVVNETSANVIAINNPGDVPCGFVATVTATGGAITNPFVANDTQYVAVVQAMANTDVVTISTVPGNCFVTYEGAVVYNSSLDSEFFLLPVGASTLTLTATAGDTYIVGSVSFVPRYLGV